MVKRDGPPVPTRGSFQLFVEYAAEIDLSDREAASLLAAHGSEMEGMGAAAYRDGEELRSRVGPGGLVAKEVVIAIGSPFMSRHGMVVPVRWRATGAEALFPSLEGELTVESAGDDRAVLRLRATYRPPLGSIGDLMDRLVLARVARATVADWVDRIVGWLEATSQSAERKHDLHHGARTDH